MDKIWARLREPSTYPGLAALVMGLGTLFKIKEAPDVVQVIGQVSEPLISGDWVGGGLLAAFGLAGIFMKEGR
ncbi:MAG: hypothetical protein JKY94_01910 [Rhodobacteraceae bacterium]|nr:hypothetical protein [Paracoccaceae bacterium]